jgi:hypothetical protein
MDIPRDDQKRFSYGIIPVFQAIRPGETPSPGRGRLDQRPHPIASLVKEPHWINRRSSPRLSKPALALK